MIIEAKDRAYSTSIARPMGRKKVGDDVLVEVD